MRATRFLVTCEHGGNRVPAAYRPLFRGMDRLLGSHRGYDPGALTIARELAAALRAPLFVSTTTRLLIDLNRSLGHPRLYSEATRKAPAEVRRRILESYYLPYRAKAQDSIAVAVAAGRRVVHIASHSFTPELDGQLRNADVGLLYDPGRAGEVELCSRWRALLRARAPQLKVRRNYPYTGRSDGFAAYLRRRFGPDEYVGVELELTQRHLLRGHRHWRLIRRQVIDALLQALQPEGRATGAGRRAAPRVPS
jgi:predicted N-formylglutamate amidohydrolase